MTLVIFATTVFPKIKHCKIARVNARLDEQFIEKLHWIWKITQTEPGFSSGILYILTFYGLIDLICLLSIRISD